MTTARTSLFALLIAAACGSAASASDLQSYTSWQYDQKNQRYVCEYQFRAQPTAPYQKQTVVYYPQGARKDYYHYYNPVKKTFWGRCAAPTHPKYNGSQMQWSYYRNNDWTGLSNQCPTIPIPGIGNLPEIELPPAIPAPPL